MVDNNNTNVRFERQDVKEFNQQKSGTEVDVIQGKVVSILDQDKKQERNI